MTILAAPALPHGIVATNQKGDIRKPAQTGGLSDGKTLTLADLFLIRGLILLAATALLVPLTGFIRHLIGLTGLIALLRLIRLILLCHVSSPDLSAALLHARATSTDGPLDYQDDGRVALALRNRSHRKNSTISLPHRKHKT
ncbi:MAG TPA: hypothetical protein VGG81_12250 [Edaphobacter sp.]|jgi:hypothetical protein